MFFINYLVVYNYKNSKSIMCCVITFNENEQSAYIAICEDNFIF